MEIVHYKREELTYQDLSGRFQLVNRDFSRQYAHIYSVRLMKFRTLLEDRVQKKWGEVQLFEIENVQFKYIILFIYRKAICH